jgi:hypothetical protein
MVIRKYLLGSLYLLLLASSCNKNRVDSGPAVIPATWGKLSVVKEEIVKVGGTDTTVETNELAQAHFYADPRQSLALTDVGEVKINEQSLAKDNNLAYLKKSASLGIGDKIEWRVNGNGFVQQFIYRDTVLFPKYKGSFPTTINKSTGLWLQFDSTTVLHADSVRVWIDDTYHHIIEQTFSAKAGMVNLSAAALASLQTINDQTAIIAIMPYAGTVKVYSNKGFFFAREQRLYRSVNIN